VIADVLPQPLSHEELQGIAGEPYEPRGILHSEMALIIHTCRAYGVEVVIESGRARGQSTYMLATYLPDTEIHSVELRGSADEEFACERLKDFANVALYSGDGRGSLPLLAASEAGGRRTAILCDGPKGAAAVEVLKDCFRMSHVRVGFVHDMRRLDHGQPSMHRAAALAAFPAAKFSDEPAIVASSSWMDANILASGGPCGPAHEAEFGSYGPTIGVFLNPSFKH
jgi:hypothetical protein